MDGFFLGPDGFFVTVVFKIQDQGKKEAIRVSPDNFSLAKTTNIDIIPRIKRVSGTSCQKKGWNTGAFWETGRGLATNRVGGIVRNRFTNNKLGILSKLTVPFLVIVLVTIFAGCGTEASTGGTFTYAELVDPLAIDPALVAEESGWNITRYLFDGLVKYDSSTGEVVPGVAEEWEVNEDATEFVFKLRKGVKFSNGRELVADDFVYSWTRALDPATESPMAMVILEPVQGAMAFASGETDKLTGVEAVDDYTLKVTLDYPLADFITFIGHPVCAPVPREEVEAPGANFGEMPVGNGPFVLKEWKHEQELVLERNADYYGDAASLDQVIVKIVPDEATQLEELKAGNIDAIKALPPGMDESLRSDETIEVVDNDVAVLRFAAFNMAASPWSENKALREAFSYAIDRETIARVVMQGHATAADAIVPASMAGHQPGALPHAYDPEQARVKLAEAGYPNGEGLPAITLTYASEGSSPDVAQAMQAQLKAVGIPVEINGLGPDDFLDQMMGQQLSFFIPPSWGADYPSVDTFLYTLFSSSLIGPGGPNISQYANEDVDMLLDEARMTLDVDERTALYHDAENQILDDAPVIPIVFDRDVMAHSTRVNDFVLTPLGELDLCKITVSDS